MLRLKIDKAALGVMLPEVRIKSGLQELNPGIFFDVGSRLNMEHPYIQCRQGVYYDGLPEGRKHVCSMDRGNVCGGLIPEVPVWNTIHDIVETTWDDVTNAELQAQEPPFPMPCLHDPNMLQIQRQVRDEVILCGWRHVFDKLIAKHIPGVSVFSLENMFNITMRDYVEPVEIPEEGPAPWDRGEGPEEGEVLESLGEFVPRPTIILPG